jgi:hypothetical protein
MSFLISSTGTDVFLFDLGIVIVHPTTDRDLSLEFLPEELSASDNLTTAITSGDLLLKIEDPEYGEYEVAETEYYPGLAVQNQYIVQDVEKYITESELKSAYADSLVHASATSIAITSTASITQNVYCSGALFQKWKVSPGDIVVITGGSADGTYTVDTIIDQQQLTVVEAIVDTAAIGTLDIFNPAGATRVGFDINNLINITGNNLQEALESIDSQLVGNGGFLTLADHQTIRHLIHFIDEGPAEGFTTGAYKEVVGAPFIESETWYTSVAKTHKIVELLITRNSQKLPTTEVWNIYSTDGTTTIATITDAYSYNGIYETSRTRTIVEGGF